MRCPSPPLPPVTRATAPLRSMSFLPYTGARLSRSPPVSADSLLPNPGSRQAIDREGQGECSDVLNFSRRLDAAEPRVTGTPATRDTKVAMQLLEKKTPG